MDWHMLSFLKNLFQTNTDEGFTKTQMTLERVGIKNYFCGIGQCRIDKNEIEIKGYPFKPSLAYPSVCLSPQDIQAVTVDFGPCELYVKNDILLVSAEKRKLLTDFAERHHILRVPHNFNWEWLLEPYLDTEFTKENEILLAQRLAENGINQVAVVAIRKEVGKEMYKYNFDTMLWEWCSLGLRDVLSAMRVKYGKEKFRDFYWRAIAIAKRTQADPRHDVMASVS